MKPFKRSITIDLNMYYSYVCINVLLSCPTRNHVILKDAFTVPYFHGMHSVSSANRKVRHFLPDQWKGAKKCPLNIP
jgi:hypothetical protein